MIIHMNNNSSVMQRFIPIYAIFMDYIKYWGVNLYTNFANIYKRQQTNVFDE